MGTFFCLPSPVATESVDTAQADSVNLLIFGTAESAVTIIAVSIPVLRALLYITPPKPRFIQQFYEETPRDGSQHPPDFGSATELVTLSSPETRRSGQGAEHRVVNPRGHETINLA